MGCGRRAVQHPRIPRAVADLLRARHDRRDAMTRRHITDLVAACPAPHYSVMGWTSQTRRCPDLQGRGGRCCKGSATRLLFGPIQTPHSGHVDCVRGWRLTGSRHVWCVEVLSGACKWCAMSCRHRRRPVCWISICPLCSWQEVSGDWCGKGLQPINHMVEPRGELSLGPCGAGTGCFRTRH